MFLDKYPQIVLIAKAIDTLCVFVSFEKKKEREIGWTRFLICKLKKDGYMENYTD